MNFQFIEHCTTFYNDRFCCSKFVRVHNWQGNIWDKRCLLAFNEYSTGSPALKIDFELFLLVFAKIRHNNFQYICCTFVKWSSSREEPRLRYVYQERMMLWICLSTRLQYSLLIEKRRRSLALLNRKGPKGNSTEHVPKYVVFYKHGYKLKEKLL